VARLFVPPDQLGKPLTAEQAHYLFSVLRLKAGDSLEVFDGRGARYRAMVEQGALRIGEALPPSARGVDVWLAQALAKGEKMDVVVQKATELGATRILPLETERAVVRGPSGKLDRWRRIAQEAARQCGRADVPEVDEPRDLAALFALLADRRALLLVPEAATRLGEAARSSEKLLVAVGPEGGFSPDEQARAVAAGMVAVGLGPLVLRTETAGLAALSVVLHVHGELG
jgi:16S rRNA (uracil1498-N3)-methyltransferase